MKFAEDQALSAVRKNKTPAWGDRGPPIGAYAGLYSLLLLMKPRICRMFTKIEMNEP